jgi:hypothetical protein
MTITKICVKCNGEKDINLFPKDKNSKGGYRNDCKECRKREYSIYRDKNKASIKERVKEWHLKNKEHNNNLSKEYYFNNLEKIKEKKREYYKSNKDKSNSRRNKYFLKHKNDQIFMLKESFRRLIKDSFRRSKKSKNYKTNDILGCTYLEFKLYLESKFELWMTWENRGLYNGEFNYGWDIDHIIPLSSAKSEEEVVKLNHYTNLQPLCSKINRDIKKDKLYYDNQ